MEQYKFNSTKMNFNGMLKKIYEELVLIKKELQAIRSSLEFDVGIDSEKIVCAVTKKVGEMRNIKNEYEFPVDVSKKTDDPYVEDYRKRMQKPLTEEQKKASEYHRDFFENFYRGSNK